MRMKLSIDAKNSYNNNNTSDFLHVQGNKIVDSFGRPVRLTGIAWYGFELEDSCFEGLHIRKLEDILDTIADLGFNILRIPLSLQLVYKWKNGYSNYNLNVNYNINTNLYGKNNLDILDITIEYCKKIGLKIVLDMHRISCNSQSELWYSDIYSKQDFEECWKWLVLRYKEVDTIIGVDIFNEPHGWGFNKEGAKWDDSKDENNWRNVAETTANIVLSINPFLLVLVEGIEIYPKPGYGFDELDISNYYKYWWGGNLRGVKEHPIRNNISQIVYSPHEYGPLVSNQPWLDKGVNKKFLVDKVWEPNWLYIQKENIAPILIGEWGGEINDNEINNSWLYSLIELIDENELHHIFWCVNPTSTDTGGIFLDDWKTVNLRKYSIIKKTLWKNNDGKFIGLSHSVPLGKYGVTL